MIALKAPVAAPMLLWSTGKMLKKSFRQCTAILEVVHVLFRCLTVSFGVFAFRRWLFSHVFTAFSAWLWLARDFYVLRSSQVWKIDGTPRQAPGCKVDMLSIGLSYPLYLAHIFQISFTDLSQHQWSTVKASDSGMRTSSRRTSSHSASVSLLDALTFCGCLQALWSVCLSL